MPPMNFAKTGWGHSGNLAVHIRKQGAWKDEQRASEFLEAIHRHTQRLAAIGEDLLQPSRLDSA